MIKLDDIEARIIGALIEKSIATPDQYPMTLNSLTNACNQKSSRDPVMSLSQGEVQHAIRVLESKHLVRTEENFKSRSEKYSQRFCATRYSDLQLDPAEIAIVCLLLLRGPQTPGELKARSSRLHAFSDYNEVAAVLQGLIDRDGEALIVKLPLSPGRKDSEYMHLFCGPIDVDEHAAKMLAMKPATTPAASQGSLVELTKRVENLEQEIAELKAQLS